MKRSKVLEVIESLWPGDSTDDGKVASLCLQLGVEVEPDEPELPERLTLESTSNLTDGTCKITTAEGVWLKVGGASLDFVRGRQVAHLLVAAYNRERQRSKPTLPYAETADDLEENAKRVLSETTPVCRWHGCFLSAMYADIRMAGEEVATVGPLCAHHAAQAIHAEMMRVQIERLRREGKATWSESLPSAPIVDGPATPVLTPELLRELCRAATGGEPVGLSGGELVELAWQLERSAAAVVVSALAGDGIGDLGAL